MRKSLCCEKLPGRKPMSSFTQKDESILDKTISLREQLLDILTQKSKDELIDNDALFKKALTLTESMDKSVIGVARIRSEDASNAGNKELIREIALAIISKAHSNRKQIMERRSKENSTEIPDEVTTDVRDEETRIGKSNEDFKSFMQRTGDTG